jgi:hypothetical protein
MSTHGRRSRRPEQGGPPDLAWSLVVIVAALIGGLAAIPLVHTSVVIAVLVSVAAGGIAILALLRPGRSAELPPGRDADTGFGPVSGSRRPAAPPTQVRPRPVPAAAPAAPGQTEFDGLASGAAPPSETIVQMLPLSQQGNASWWDSAQGAPPAPSSGAKRASAPDLSTYMASTFIAQCPNCGAFRLDIRQARNAWDFRCQACEFTWTWQPGTPWPPVRVMPRRRRELPALSP